MTAPAVVAPSVIESAPAPIAAPESSPTESFGSALDRIIQQAPIPNEDPNAPRGIPAGGVSGPETGTAGVPQTDPTAPTDGVPPTTAPATDPTGELAVDDGDLVLSAERNADGTFKAAIDPTQKFDFKVKDKETGETHAYSKTIPEIMRMAKDGVWGQKVRGEVSYYRDNVPKWQAEHQGLTQTAAQLRTELDAQMQLNRELLTADEALVVARREEFAKLNSPEQRLARLEQEIKDREERATMTARESQQAKQVTDFANARLAPILAAAEAKVGPELVKMKLALDMVPFQVNGKVPPERLAALESHLNGPFMDWIAQEAARRSAPDPKVAEAEAIARRAQAANQQLVNTVGRATAPVGNVAHAGADLTKPQAPPKNVNDVIDRIVSRPLMAQGR